MTAIQRTAEPMRFNVDMWDAGYGTAMDADGLAESGAVVTPDVELPEDRWAPIDPDPAVALPDMVLFVDGVRRVDARVWIDELPGPTGLSPASATAAICASYAAGVVCCCEGRAHLTQARVRRGLFTVAPHAADIPTTAGTYRAWPTEAKKDTPLALALSLALQRQLGEVEVAAAVAARSEPTDHPASESDLLVVDGPLRGRAHLDRAVGFVKTHQSGYLPAELNAVVGTLGPGQRTPVFHIGQTWERHSWYLRLPCEPGSPWAGVVRLEAAPGLSRDDVVALANLTQAVLGRYASDEYKDARAPQNLYPIAGLERDLRHRLGDQQVVYRALRTAAAVRGWN